MDMPINLFDVDATTGTIRLQSPTGLPDACGFLWNSAMMVQVNCRGYAQAQHMQPEPAKYARGPSIEAQTFMQPEHHYYVNHPGRFVYIKESGKELFSIPFAPVNHEPESFVFEHSDRSLRWIITQHELRFIYTLSLPEDDSVECWQLQIENLSGSARELSVVPYFPFGYMSWMNQSATYESALSAIVAKCITPYQRLADYPKIKQLKDLSFFSSAEPPSSWTCVQNDFEGLSGLHDPSGLHAKHLSHSDAQYEVPTAAMQFDLSLSEDGSKTYRWLFGPAKDKEAIADLNQRYLTGASRPAQSADKQLTPLHIETPDAEFDVFVNHWLPRQIRYHSESNRLTTDPQTRNFLQDQMTMIYLQPEKAKQALVLAMQQQAANGEMPDGLLLHPDAELKYINQIPHSDHNVWLIIFIANYLAETNDFAFLNEQVAYIDHSSASVHAHIEAALNCLLDNLDQRGLALIHQGDWCDPMNMVGHRGKGVSAWLTMATSYCAKRWSQSCNAAGLSIQANMWQQTQVQLNAKINEYFWSKHWYGRGITDDGRLFGIEQDQQGKIFLNPQAWAILCDAVSSADVEALIAQVESQLRTPFGPMLLAPSFTEMHEDIGRVTQKSAGVAENGSVYNHAAAFYATSLYESGQANLGFTTLKQMLPNHSDARVRGQLPVYIPNYYRGAYHQYPSHAGKSSHLFNTGTLAWFYYSLNSGLFGLSGTRDGLHIQPQLPSNWETAKVSKVFRGVTYNIHISHDANTTQQVVSADLASVTGNCVHAPEADEVRVEVLLPTEKPAA